VRTQDEDYKMTFPDIRGWCTERDRQFMYDRIIESNAKSVLEIGVFCGRMTVALVEGVRVTGGIVHSVDPWQEMEMENGAEVAREFLYAMTRYRFQDRIRIYATTSSYFAKQFCGHFDLVYIDGEHAYDNVMSDIKTLYPRSMAIYGHDWQIDSVRCAVEEYARLWNLHESDAGGETIDYNKNWNIRACKVDGADHVWTLAKV
jgi:hypothetical protein